MRQSPRHGRHGFVLHNDCWLLLNKGLSLTQADLQRLLEICQSLPVPQWWDGVDWGHDYGKLLHLNINDQYPWGDPLEEFNVETEVCHDSQFNPYERHSISSLLQRTTDVPTTSIVYSSLGDCFTRLAWEVREIVASFLPIEDALNLRAASRSFAPLLTSQAFWASRFKPRHERGHVFEALQDSNVNDWITLYQCTSPCHAPPALRNRRRIWKLIQIIGLYLQLRLPQQLNSTICDSQHSDLLWTETMGDLVEGNTFYSTEATNGRRIFNINCVFVPNNLAKIAISTIPAGGAHYIAGIRLIDIQRHSTQLAYRSKTNEVMVDVKDLRGFVASTGPQGIRGLKVLRADGTSSNWIGRPHVAPATDVLTCVNRVTALRATFDVS